MAITLQILTDNPEVFYRMADAQLHIRTIMGGYEISIDTARDLQKAYQILKALGLE